MSQRTKSVTPIAEAEGAGRVDFAIGAALKKARQDRQLSQRALGLLIGVSQQQLQKYEKGQNRLSAMMLISLAKALNIQPAELLPYQYVTEDEKIFVALNDDQRELLDGFADMSLVRRRALLDLVRAATIK